MPKLILTGGKEVQIPQKTAEELYKLKYGEKGGKKSDPKTPYYLENYGSIELRDVRSFVEDPKSITYQDNYSKEEIKSHLAMIKDFKDLDDYCLQQEYIRIDETQSGGIVICKPNEYTAIKKLHNAGMSYLRSVKRFKQNI